MNPGVLIMILAMLLVSCGVSQRDRHAAWLQAFHLERDAAYQQWETDVARRGFSTDTAAVRDLKARYEKVYTRWALPMDLLTEALLTYAVALAIRVDRGEVGRQDAVRLCDRLRAEIDLERGRLARETNETQRETAERDWWEGFWKEQQETYQASKRMPIRCVVFSSQIDGSSIMCE